jgi:hypothetical protein
MNYTLEHLKIAYNAGAKKFPFDQTLELISLLGNEGLHGLLAHPGATSKAVSSSPTPFNSAHYKRRAKASSQDGKAKKRGATLSKRILGFLSEKGHAGAHVKDIAKSLEAPLASVTVWFYNTGKNYLKTGEIKKVAPATFSYSPAAKVE